MSAHQPNPTGHRSNHRLFASPLAFLGAFVLFAGMLFWTKLRLVSDIPRTAYAVPEETAAPLEAESAGDPDLATDEREDDGTPDGDERD